jgi:hypothetical protein
MSTMLAEREGSSASPFAGCGGIDMRKFNALVFDEFIPNNTQIFTNPALNENLGAFDKLSLFAIGDNFSSGATLTVQIQHSADQRNWTNKNGTAEINGTSIAANTVLAGFDTSSSGSFGFVRLAITLGGTTPSTHLKLYVTARDTVQ